MMATVIVNFVKGAMGAVGIFVAILLLMEFLMAVSEIASADVPVRRATLGEQDRSVSGSQHIPGGTHDHQFDYLMYEIASGQNDVDDSTPAPFTAAPDTPCTHVSPVPDHEALDSGNRSGRL